MEDHAPSLARTKPVKTRDLHSHHFDSTMWDDTRFRDDDIVISTYAKSGTTWMQQIVSQLIFDGAENIQTAAISPWVDLRVPPRHIKLPEIEVQTHRRFLKTHAQDCVPLSGAFWEGGAQTFLHKGINGRWQGVLPEADSADLKARMLTELGADCAEWMQNGGKVLR